MMPLRTAFALLLLLPFGAAAQDLDRAISALVRISGERDGVLTRGSGFVVGLDRDLATIVTASHVIEGAAEVAVSFAADPIATFPAGLVLGMEAGSPRGLAVFQVRGALPAGLGTLSFDAEVQLVRGEELFVLGFPHRAKAPLALRRTFAGPDGNLLQLDLPAGEGLSGSPVLRGGRVVGVVTDEDPLLTFAVGAVVARNALLGWGVAPGGTVITEPAVPEEPTPETGGAGGRAAILHKTGLWVTEELKRWAAQRVTLQQGKPLSFLEGSLTLSVSFSAEHGGFATLRIVAVDEPTIVKAVLGPGGEFPFRSRSGEHRLSVIDWRPETQTLELTISPGLE